MPQALGSNTYVAFQEETTYKTDPGTPAMKKLHFVTESIKKSQPLSTTPIIRNNRNPTAPVRGNINVSGSLNTHLQAFQLGTLIKALLGSVSVTGTGPYIHTIKIGSSIPSLTIEKAFTDLGTPQYFKYNGCKVNSFSLNCKSEGFQDCNFDIVGAKETVGTSAFDATLTDAGYSAFDGFSVATITEGGSSIAIIQEISINIENGLDDSVYVIGGAGERASLPEGVVKVSGTVKAIFDSITLYNKAINNTESAINIVYQLGTGDGSAGNEYFGISIPELKYETSSPVISGPAGIMVDLPFQAYYANDAGASSVIVTIKNTEATL